MRTEALIHSADIPATILDYVGIKPPESYYGQSYKPVIDGEITSIRNLVQGNVITTRSKDPNNVMGDHVEGYWVREGHWFLRWHVTYGEIELFDLRTDLRNDINVADEHPEVLERMLDLAKAYKEEHGDDPRLAYYKGLN